MITPLTFLLLAITFISIGFVFGLMWRTFIDDEEQS